MRILICILIMIVVSCAVLILGYPLLHELGHLFAARILGVPIVGAGFFPEAHVSFLLDEPTVTEVLLLSFGADIFVALILLIPSRRSLILFTVRMSLAVMWFADTVSSTVYSTAYIFGFANAYDDAVKALMLYPGSYPAILMILSAEAVYCVIVIKNMDILGETFHYLAKYGNHVQ